MIPRCHNRAPFAGQWFRAGVRRCADGRVRIVLRWRPFLMSQKCGAWSAPSGALPLPVLEGWECAGCRWLPA
jgi:hypothetical protein